MTRFEQYLNMIDFDYSSVDMIDPGTESLKWDIDGIVNEEELIILGETNWMWARQTGLLLCELYDKTPEDLAFIGDGNNFKMTFSTDEYEYLFVAKPTKDNTWVVVFGVRGHSSFPIIQTGWGASMVGRVYAGVFASIQHLINKKHPDFIEFNTDSVDLIDTYDKMKPYIEKRLHMKLDFRKQRGSTIFYRYKVIK